MSSTKSTRSWRNDRFDPVDFHYQAIVSGVYSSMLSKEVGAQLFRKGKKQERLDAEILRATKEKAKVLFAFRDIMSKAFATATQLLQRTGLVDQRTGDLNKKGREKSVLRYNGKYIGSDRKLRGFDELVNSRQSYEEMLAIVRKTGFYRVTEEPTADGYRFFVWPLPPGERVPGPASKSVAVADKIAKELNRMDDPRKTNRWHVPASGYTRRELSHWLPPDSIFKL